VVLHLALEDGSQILFTMNFECPEQDQQ